MLSDCGSRLRVGVYGNLGFGLRLADFGCRVWGLWGLEVGILEFWESGFPGLGPETFE